MNSDCRAAFAGTHCGCCAEGTNGMCRRGTTQQGSQAQHCIPWPPAAFMCNYVHVPRHPMPAARLLTLATEWQCHQSKPRSLWSHGHCPGSDTHLSKLGSSPRITVPYHTLAPLPSLTSPMTEALGATNTSVPSTGRLPPNACTHCALFTAGRGRGGSRRRQHLARGWRWRRPGQQGWRRAGAAIGARAACN